MTAALSVWRKQVQSTQRVQWLRLHLGAAAASTVRRVKLQQLWDTWRSQFLIKRRTRSRHEKSQRKKMSEAAAKKIALQLVVKTTQVAMVDLFRKRSEARRRMRLLRTTFFAFQSASKATSKELEKIPTSSFSFQKRHMGRSSASFHQVKSSEGPATRAFLAGLLHVAESYT